MVGIMYRQDSFLDGSSVAFSFTELKNCPGTTTTISVLDDDNSETRPDPRAPFAVKGSS